MLNKPYTTLYNLCATYSLELINRNESLCDWFTHKFVNQITIITNCQMINVALDINGRLVFAMQTLHLANLQIQIF